MLGPGVRAMPSATAAKAARVVDGTIVMSPDCDAPPFSHWRGGRAGAAGAWWPCFRGGPARPRTPGCLIFKVSGDDSDVIFTGDAAKNRAELISGDTDMTYDAAVSRATIDAIWRMWREKPGTIVVPGHDIPMRIDGDEPRYLGTRKAMLNAWFGRDMTTLTKIDLTRA